MQLNTFAERTSQENRKQWIIVSVGKKFIFIILLCIFFLNLIYPFSTRKYFVLIAVYRSILLRGTCSGCFSLCYNVVLISISEWTPPSLGYYGRFFKISLSDARCCNKERFWIAGWCCVTKGKIRIFVCLLWRRARVLHSNFTAVGVFLNSWMLS